MNKRLARTFDNVRFKRPVIDLDEVRMDALFWRLFTSPDGRLALEYLRQLTKEEVVGADATDSALRMKEGQRQLVARIEGMVLSGERARTAS